MRTILKFAVENGIYVAREHVYFDLGVRGHKSKRDGLDQLRQALRAKKVKVRAVCHESSFPQGLSDA